MITTPLLEDKYKAQKQLDEEAQHDIAKYAASFACSACKTSVSSSGTAS